MAFTSAPIVIFLFIHLAADEVEIPFLFESYSYSVNGVIVV